MPAVAVEPPPPVQGATPEQAPALTLATAPRDAILSLDQAAEILGESPEETRDLTSMGLLKHQVIDGERCVWLSDLLTYKRDFARDFSAYLADPLSRLDDDSPNPVDVLPEYAHMRRV